MVDWEAKDYAGETLGGAIVRSLIVSVVLGIFAWAISGGNIAITFVWGPFQFVFRCLMELARPRH